MRMFAQQIPFLFRKNHRACYLKIISLLYAIEIKKIVEIGVFRGKNARRLRELFPDARLYLVDPWKPDPDYLAFGGAVATERKTYEEAFLEVQTLFQNDPKTRIIRKTSIAAAAELPSDLDVVFIDANHSYSCVKQDILTYFPKRTSRSILAGHNYGHPHLPGVKKAVDELFGSSCYLGQDRVWVYLHSSPRRSCPQFEKQSILHV